jgi:hypothetical protein
MTSRRFPGPWTVEQTPGGFKVLDANGQALVYVYARETKAEADIAKVLTFDEARRIAVNVAQLPELLGKPKLCLPNAGFWQWHGT